MGNDVLILYYRKNSPNSKILNRVLGKKIWNWIETNDKSAELLEEDKPCIWGNNGKFIADDYLPKTAAEYSFNRNILPDLFNYLDTL